jgi:hypothetical protein
VKKLALALLLCGLASSAFAACPSPLTGKDAAGTTQNFQITTDSTGNNCIGTVAQAQLTNPALAVWNSATTLNTNIDIPYSGQFPFVKIRLVTTSTITTGAVTFRLKGPDGTYVTAPVAQVQNSATFAPLTNPYTLVATTTQDFLVKNTGDPFVNVQLSTAITGTGTLTVSYNLASYDPETLALTFPIICPAGGCPVVNLPTSIAASTLTSVTCGSAVSSCVLKNAQGNFYGTYAECTSACWLMVFNSTSAPSNGATTAGTGSGNLVECVDVPANSARSITYPVLPVNYSAGITVAISSTACATLTLSTVGFIRGTVM